jgi:GNAT superfamily N-acetyltransferase
VLEERPLDPSIHDRQGFDCGVAALNDYLARLADQHRRKGVSAVYVLVEDDAPSEILGYYTLSAAEVAVDRLTDVEGKRLPRHPVPCIRMGRLACRTDRRGSGLGKLLVGLAVDRCLQVRQQLGAYALIVDAKDDEARRFYEHFGFRSLRDTPLTLYLPLGRG